MKIRRPFVFEIWNLLIWLLLLIIQVLGLLEGLASFYLPISLILLLISQLSRKRPAFDISIIFLLSCIFFFCIGLILWPFSNYSPREFSSLVITTFTWTQLDSAAICVGLSIAITMVTMRMVQVGDRSYNEPQLILSEKYDQGLYRIGLVFIFVSLPVVTVEMVEQIRFIQAAGYFALFSDGVSVSVISKVFLYIYYLGFRLTIAFCKTKRQFLLPAILFLIIATIDSLKGARGSFFVPLLFVTWFYVARFNVKVRLLTVLQMAIMLIFIFAVMTSLRDSDMLDNSILQFAVDALISQGRSLQTIAIYQTVVEEVAQYGNYMVLSNLLIPFNVLIHPEIREAAQSLDQVLYSNNLKHILTYVLNEGYYFSGGGTGGVYVIELLESGPFFYVILSMLLGWFFAWMPAAMSNPLIRYLSIYFFTTIFYLPRGEFFFNTLIVGKALFLYLVVMELYKLYMVQKNIKRSVS